MPEWLFDQQYGPTFATTHEYRHIWTDADYSQDNLRAWNSFFRKGVDQKALERLLYGVYNKEYGSVERSVLVNSIMFNNTSLPEAKAQAAKTYFKLSLELEALADNADVWYYDPPESMSDAEKEALIRKLKDHHKKEQFAFLKDRYAYQLLKAYRYSGQLDKAIALYNEHFKDAQKTGMIHYWAMDHMAGIELEKNKNAEAYYHFMKVFQECRSRRHSAYYSFHITNQKDWEKTYALCGTSEEKALMHFLRGSKSDALGLQDARDIFSLLGNHEWLKLLLAREINKVEQENFSYFSDAPIETLIGNLEQKGHLLQNKDYAAYVGELLGFVNTVYYNNRKDGFWIAAKAYLEFISGKLETAKSTLKSNASLNAPYDKIAKEIEMAILIIEQDQLSVEEQNQLAADITSIFDDPKTHFFTDRNNQEFILDLLAFKARKSGKEMLGNMFARDLIFNEKDNPEMANVEELLSFVRQSEHTDLELLALKHYFNIHNSWSAFIKDTVASLKNMEYILQDIKGTLLMRDPDQLDAALAIFESLPDSFDFELMHNPFNMDIQDCVWDCYTRTTAKYTRKSFVRKLIEMKELADRTHSPTDYYLLGNAYYNMTYFGPAYYLMNYYRSGSMYTGYYDCQAALDFYDKAMKYAPSDEFAAKACFMAAKAEQNLYFAKESEEEDPDQYWWGKYEVPDTYYDVEQYRAFHKNIKNAGYRKYFDTLERNYKNTNYYRKAIAECKYLEYYVSKW